MFLNSKNKKSKKDLKNNHTNNKNIHNYNYNNLPTNKINFTKNENINSKNIQDNKNNNHHDDFSKKTKNFTNKSIAKTKNLFIKYNNFVIKNENKIYSYYFFSSIWILIIMLFVSMFINSNLGYSLNGVELEWNYGLVIAGAVFGFLCFFIYLPIFVFSITQFVDFIKKKKFDFKFYLMVIIQLFNLYFFLTIIIFSIMNYRLFYIHEILYVFMVFIFWLLHAKKEINFNNFKKIKINKNNQKKLRIDNQQITNK